MTVVQALTLGGQIAKLWGADITDPRVAASLEVFTDGLAQPVTFDKPAEPEPEVYLGFTREEFSNVCRRPVKDVLLAIAERNPGAKLTPRQVYHLWRKFADGWKPSRGSITTELWLQNRSNEGCPSHPVNRYAAWIRVDTGVYRSRF
jgi:hypothetical protein